MLGFGLLLLAIILFFLNRVYPALLIYFGFVTNGYQLIPPGLIMAGAPTDKLTDLALIFLIVTLISRSKSVWAAFHNEASFRWACLFVIFVAIDGIYSLMSEGYAFGGVIRVFRVNIFLLSFGLFLTIPFSTLTKTFHTLAIITVAQCAIYLIQIPINLALLNSALAGSDVATTTVDKFSFTRFYNTPVFLTPTLFYYLFYFRCRTNIIHWIIVGLLIVAVVAPLHRIYIFSIITTASLYTLFKQDRSQRALYISVLLLVGYGVSLIDVVSYRVNEGMEDLTKTFTTKGSMADVDYGENTFTYRMAHFVERINHITQKTSGYIFGIGLLSEDSKQAEKLTFRVGAFDERIGRVSQINTGDIAWSLLVLQLGIVGTVIFIIMLIQFLKLFIQNHSNPYGSLGLLSLSTTFIISFAGTELLMIPFRTLLIFLAVIVIKTIRRPLTHVLPVSLHSQDLEKTTDKLEHSIHLSF